MGVLSWLLGTGTSKVIEAVGTAVNKNIKTLKGDKAEVEAAIADEQLATLASHAAEFAQRSTRTKLDSVIDFINRLPRPLIVFWALSFLVIPYFAPSVFLEYVLSLSMIPSELWTLILAVFSFFLGSRIISSDLRKPKMGEEEKRAAIEIIRERERVILENRTPLIVEAPTRKPEPPAWTLEQVRTVEVKLPPKLSDIINQPNTKGRSEAVDRMIENLLVAEGGFVDHPADRGGATNHGITIGTLEAWRGRECTVDDVKSLTEEESTDIYLKNYFFGPSIDSLELPLQAHVFDVCVNSGQGTAVKMLQRVLNEMGEDIKVDGIIGEMTRQACSRHPSNEINNNLVKARLKFYDDIVKRNPSQKVFIKGWKKRANSFRVA